MNEFLIWKLLALFGVYLGGLVVATFLHELGHAVAALRVTTQRIALQVGRTGCCSFSFGRLDISFSSRGLRYGFTRYDRTAVSRERQTVVAVCGPLASLIVCLACVFFALNSVSGEWIWILWIGLLVANFRILIVALWPMEYRPDGPEGEVWLSDALDVWRMWRS